MPPKPVSLLQRLSAPLAYAAMLFATVIGFLVVRARGETLVAPDTAGAVFRGQGSQAHVEILPHLLVAIGVVIVASRLLGTLFKRLNQPPVIGEVIAGIMLGPSLLGYLAPSVSAQLLPTVVMPHLGTVAQVGVILFMFLVGIDLDTELLKQRSHSSVAISHASIVAPFVLGSSLALFIYPRLSSRDVPFTYFALFMGVSMSVTAFPVLARILTDQKMHRSRMGVIALACAAIDDVTAWCLLAFVVSVVKARAGGAFVTIGLTTAYIAFMLLVVRPVCDRFVRYVESKGSVSQGAVAVVVVALLASALATQAIGIHALFGAFLLGALIPHDSVLGRGIVAKLEDIVVVMFLPAFFAFTGMRTQIGLLDGAEHWFLCGLIILVACAGKFGGTLVAAKITGLGWRDSAALGLLMNTRGLMELIVLNIGLDLRVISPTLFAMMVLMALITTLLTTPLLHLLGHKPSEQAMPVVATIPPAPGAPHA